MNIKLYIFICIITALPCVSVAEQSERYAAEQKAFAEKYATELKVSSEKYATELKASSEKYAAELKASEKSNAEQIAIHKKYSDEQIAIHKKYSDEQIAIHKKYSDEQKVQTERYTATQMAAAASAVNANNELSDKNAWLKAITEKFNAFSMDINESYSHCGPEKSLFYRTIAQAQEIGTATLYGSSFNTACQAHDACYDDCLASKFKCDQNLLVDAERVCESAFLKTACISLANTYFYFVVTRDEASREFHKNCPKPVAKQPR